MSKTMTDFIKTRTFERWSPFVLLILVLLLWQAVVVVFNIADFIFPSQSWKSRAAS